jgi:predicted transcriptional regulator of viral defense system
MPSQVERARELLLSNGLMRSAEFKSYGITAATLSRMSADGIVVRLGRGLYQLVDAPIEADHTLAEAAKRVPRAVVCLVSALAFHGLTDQHPRRVWLAIGHKDWAPKLDTPAIRVVRFSDKLLSSDVDRATVEGVDVKVFSPVRTIVDLFRHERLVGLPLAIEGLKALLRTRGATASAVAEKAQAIGVWTKVRPYLETLASDA